jgi:aminoglycoside phosphotransferase (APT) family kinase protein
MSFTAGRDLDEVRVGLAGWLGRQVGVIDRPPAGFSCETLIVDRALVVRLPPLGEGIFPTYDLAQQAAVQNAAGAAGVPVAGPARYEPDPSFLGTPFIAMPFAPGVIPSDFTPTDPWLSGLSSDEVRRSVWEGYIDSIVAIHRTTVAPELGLRTGLAEELEAWASYIEWSTEGVPPAGLLEVMAWCRGHVPADEPPAGLLWGDVRLGNVVFDEASAAPRAILDWDMASAGPIEMDLAWHLALEGVQTELTGMVVPGFGTRDEAVARVTAALGRPLQDLRWFEVFALLRASAVSTRIAMLQTRAGGRPMFEVGRDPTLTAALGLIER